MTKPNIDLTKLQKVYFKPGFDQLYSHQVVDGYYDSNTKRFYVEDLEHFWDEDDILEFKICKQSAV